MDPPLGDMFRSVWGVFRRLVLDVFEDGTRFAGPDILPNFLVLLEPIKIAVFWCRDSVRALESIRACLLIGVGVTVPAWKFSLGAGSSKEEDDDGEDEGGKGEENVAEHESTEEDALNEITGEMAATTLFVSVEASEYI